MSSKSYQLVNLLSDGLVQDGVGGARGEEAGSIYNPVKFNYSLSTLHNVF
jgi:hypothetical protein